MSDIANDHRDGNEVLSLLLDGWPDALSAHLQVVELKRGQRLYAPHDDIHEIYFPTSGLISIVATTAKGEATEVAVVGRAGLTGLPLYRGARNLALHVTVQIPGEAMTIGSGHLIDLIEREPLAARLLDRATHAYIALLAQTASCNRSHDVEQRLARWLLVGRDGAGTEMLELTQELLAVMIGVQRPTVTLAAGTFQRDGLIDYRRGRIRITDPVGLLRRSCECYETVRSEQRRVMHGTTPRQLTADDAALP